MDPTFRLDSQPWQNEPDNHPPTRQGVVLNEKTGKWVVILKYLGMSFHFGVFDTAEEAVKYHDLKSMDMFGKIIP